MGLRELPLSLQLLFPGPVGLSARELGRMLGELHPSLAQARVEIRTSATDTGLEQRVRVKWGQHTVHVTLVDTPIPAELMEQAVEPAHYGDELKDKAEAHTAHAVISYWGEEPDPLEQYLTLGMIAVALAPLGAIVVLNATAYTSYPIQLLVPRPGEDLDKLLRALPLTSLFVGFVTVQVEGVEGVWMRTCGAPLMDLPDLAWHAHSYDETQRMFFVFNDIFLAMRSAGVRFSEGDKVEEGELHWKFRRPHANEGVLDSPRMIVLERDPHSGAPPS
jgi:hypothetical protein